MQTYIVWFHQVNGCMYEVMAATEESAVQQARALWKQDEWPPRVEDIRLVGGKPR